MADRIPSCGACRRQQGTQAVAAAVRGQCDGYAGRRQQLSCIKWTFHSLILADLFIHLVGSCTVSYLLHGSSAGSMLHNILSPPSSMHGRRGGCTHAAVDWRAESSMQLALAGVHQHCTGTQSRALKIRQQGSNCGTANTDIPPPAQVEQLSHARTRPAHVSCCSSLSQDKMAFQCFGGAERHRFGMLAAGEAK